MILLVDCFRGFLLLRCFMVWWVEVNILFRSLFFLLGLLYWLILCVVWVFCVLLDMGLVFWEVISRLLIDFGWWWGREWWCLRLLFGVSWFIWWVGGVGGILVICWFLWSVLLRDLYVFFGMGMGVGLLIIIDEWLFVYGL